MPRIHWNPPPPAAAPSRPPPSVQAVPGSACGSATLEVPLHARYPHPSQPGQQREGALPGWLQAAQSAAAAAELPAPTVLVQCPSGGDAAEWQAAELQSSPAAASVRWDMPAGNLRHGPLVAIGTAAAVGCGVAAVLRALLAPVAAQAQRRQPRQKRQ